VRTRTRVVVAASTIGLYVGLAALSGHLSPAARGPVLDGLGPLQPYRWVNPPASLAPTNKAPSVGTFVARFVKGGLQGQVFVNGDGQATVIVPKNAFPANGRDIAVVLTLTPVDPATLGPLPDDNVAFGNAYRLTAAYRPSGERAPSPAAPIDLVLLYPVTPDLHAATHAIYGSNDGKTWSALPGTDTPTVQQVEGKIGHLGYAAIGGVLAPVPSVTSTGTSSGGDTSVRTILLAVAASVLLVGIGLLLRTRGGGTPPPP
jgi:hypothetical protein